MSQGRRPDTPPPLCACGCGEQIQNWLWGRWKKYLPRHRHPSKGHITGAKNPRWRGGAIRTRDGYVLVQAPPAHPRRDRRGYVKRAVLVLERKLGRYLQPDEHVHHINHVRDDDRPENLKALDRCEHSRLHRADRLEGRRRNGFHSGSRNGQSKLKERDVDDIFRLRSAGLSQQTIADRYGVSQVLISKILRGVAWWSHTHYQAHSTAT